MEFKLVAHLITNYKIQQLENQERECILKWEEIEVWSHKLTKLSDMQASGDYPPAIGIKTNGFLAGHQSRCMSAKQIGEYSFGCALYMESCYI